MNVLRAIFILIASLTYANEPMVHQFESISNIYALDREVRVFEKEQLLTALPLIQQRAKELGAEFFENFEIPEIVSDSQAWELRTHYVPILYKLGMTKEAAFVNQKTFEFLFPEFHRAVMERLTELLGENYLEKCNQWIESFLSDSDQILKGSYRIKSTHSIWKKIPSLEALSCMSKQEFAVCVNDFIGVRWEMKIPENGNRYDALMNGVRLMPLKNLISFRNQQLPQVSGFSNEPIMKMYYSIEGFPFELQLLGGPIAHYMCVKGYTDYKTKLSLSPKLDSQDPSRRLQMAIELDAVSFRKMMMGELIGQIPNYSAYAPFVLDERPLLENNLQCKFLGFPKPVWQTPNLIFNDPVQFDSD